MTQAAEVTFKISAADRELITDIAKRARQLADLPRDSVLTFAMDLTACHANGCPLDLRKLLAADDFNLSHDVFGINRHIDHETGQLRDCFLPRCALPEA